MRFCFKTSLPNILIIGGMALFALVSQPMTVFANLPTGTPPAVTFPDPDVKPPPPGSPTVTPTDAALDAAAAAGGGVLPAVAAEAAAATPPKEIPPYVGEGIYRVLFNFVITVFGSLFYFGGVLFDTGLNKYVLGFGNEYYNENVGIAIEAVWTIVRDLFNLTFIFGLVYIGFKMILDSSDSRARSMLISLIGAALLVNFSLFIVKFVIDVANIAAGAIAQGLASEGSEYLSVSNGFMNLINFSTILAVTADQMSAFSDGAAFAYIFGLMIFLGVAAFVFAAGGILMIIRFVVLCIYMVFSPVMFIGWVFPAMAHHSKKYITGFLGNAFFAPAFVLMLYLSYKVLSEYTIAIGNVDFARIFTEGSEAAVTTQMAIPFFVLTMVFLILSLVVAKNMGAVGASTAISIGNKLRGNVQTGLQNAALAPLRFGGRTALGIAGNQMEKYNDKLQTTRFGRNVKRAVSVVSLGSFTERERLATIEAARKAKLGGKYSYDDDKKFREGTQQRTNALEASKKRHHNYDHALETLEDTSKTADELNVAFKELQDTIGAMTKEEKDHLGKAKLTDQRVAVHLTDADIDALDKTGHYSTQDIQDIKNARKLGFAAIATNGHTLSGANVPAAAGSSVVGDMQRSALVNRSIQDVGKMPVSVFINEKMATHITPQMLQERMKNGGVTNTQLDEIRTNIEDNVIHTAAPDLRLVRMWRNWSDNTTYGAQIGINF